LCSGASMRRVGGAGLPETNLRRKERIAHKIKRLRKPDLNQASIAPKTHTCSLRFSYRRSKAETHRQTLPETENQESGERIETERSIDLTVCSLSRHADPQRGSRMLAGSKPWWSDREIHHSAQHGINLDLSGWKGTETNQSA